jgi:hypothetical protein
MAKAERKKEHPERDAPNFLVLCAGACRFENDYFPNMG